MSARARKCLRLLAKEGALKLDLSDDIVASMLIVHRGFVRA